jgi:regulator of protease activity HflC (stomatin/prohibitin superfamily)
MKKIFAVIAVAVAALVLSGCSQVNTQPDTVALHYSGGLSSTNYIDCTGPSTKNYSGPGDQYFYYPYGQRTYTFDDGGESGPITVVTKDNVTMTLPGVVTFKLNTARDKDGNCQTLKEFHENIGIKYEAYFDDTGGTNGEDTGWVTMLKTYVGNQISRAANDAAKGFTSQQLYSDAKSKHDFEQAITEDIPTLVKQFSGGDYFNDWTIVLKQITPPQSIVDAYNAQQAAVAAAAAQKQQADAQVAVENAKALQTEAQVKSISQLVRVLGVEGYIQFKAIEEGKITVLPIPAGSSVIANPKP